MIKKIVRYLKKNNEYVSMVESMTGGLLSYEFVKISGASTIFEKSFITYSMKSKIDFGVDEQVILKYGIVSLETASAMVYELFKQTKADLCISVTGNAGPTLQDDKAALEVYIGVLYKDHLHVEHVIFSQKKRISNIKTCVKDVGKAVAGMLNL